MTPGSAPGTTEIRELQSRQVTPARRTPARCRTAHQTRTCDGKANHLSISGRSSGGSRANMHRGDSVCPTPGWKNIARGHEGWHLPHRLSRKTIQICRTMQTAQTAILHCSEPGFRLIRRRRIASSELGPRSFADRHPRPVPADHQRGQVLAIDQHHHGTCRAWSLCSLEEPGSVWAGQSMPVGQSLRPTTGGRPVPVRDPIWPWASQVQARGVWRIIPSIPHLVRPGHSLRLRPRPIAVSRDTRQQPLCGTRRPPGGLQRAGQPATAASISAINTLDALVDGVR